jgi:predicted lysophospholipase L1 biosynthesis ABC-type transport system permease subunit
MALAGGTMLLIGGLLIFYLIGNIAVVNILPLFLIGIGVIFTILGLVTLREPKADDARAFLMLPRAYLVYGVLAVVVGVVWLSWPIQMIWYVLAGLLILFGVVFLIYAGLTYRAPRAPQKVCSNCGAYLKPQAPFCDKCGKQVGN